MNDYTLRVISGAQTGVDISALRAAKKAGLLTGGFMPKGFKTRSGPHPDWAEEFNLTEMPTDSYKKRTWENVRAADATIRIARNFRTPGEICTVNAITYYHKPDLAIPWPLWRDAVMWRPSFFAVKEVATWIFGQQPTVKVLNVAGNGLPELEGPVEEYLTELFTYVAAVLR